MVEQNHQIRNFIEYFSKLSGDEKGEAQVFCDRLFQAFGHEGYKEAGASLEFRVRTKGKTTKFPDLVWKPRLLLEMKKRGSDLSKHYEQAFEYWLELVPDRPKYMVICNFDEFWIYDLNQQLREPVDKVKTIDLLERESSLNFLYPGNKQPIFQNNLADVTRTAANKVAKVYKVLVQRGEQKEAAQRFALQCVIALFSEDIGLLPKDLFSTLLQRCATGESSYDLIPGLFRQMGSPKSAPADSEYANVPYFNGGIFETVESICLKEEEITLLLEASKEKWSKVDPAIFGTLFEGSMGDNERHALGAHYTSEIDILKVVRPTLIKPFLQRINEAKTLSELISIRDDLLKFKVLDPACGSGNFLYVAYREMKRLESLLLSVISERFKSKQAKAVGSMSLIKTTQFYGMDIKPFAVELAKVTLMLGKKLAIDEELKSIEDVQLNVPIELESALPLDNLNQNIQCRDALLFEWEEADAIIGNPPYQAKNKMQKELGRDYLQKIREAHPQVPGRADYCVYWFRIAHDRLKPGCYAGLVGTNTIRQNYSREGSLDYIIQNGGTITEAVSTQVWSGDAVVHVSIVNWKNGVHAGEKKLFTQVGDQIDSPWKIERVKEINGSLSTATDTSSAKILLCNKKPKFCYQGQTHGHESFLLNQEEAQDLVSSDSKLGEVIFPYLIGDDILSSSLPTPSRYIIDLHTKDLIESSSYKSVFKRLEEGVLVDRQKAAEHERLENEKAKASNPRARVNKHHANFLNSWWVLSYPRKDLITKLGEIERYIACSRVTKRPIFEFVSTKIRPSDSLVVFPIQDDYSFGIIQSNVHWSWFTNRCSTLKADYRYTSNTVFDTYPFPQEPRLSQATMVAKCARELRELRRQLCIKYDASLREIYKTLDLPGKSELKEAISALDHAVLKLYGFSEDKDTLSQLLDLNQLIYLEELRGNSCQGAGLPKSLVEDMHVFTSSDCINP